MIPFVGAALAGDQADLEEGLPVSFVDARPIAQHAALVEVATRYAVVDGAGRVVLAPRVAYGPLRSAQVGVTAPLRVEPGGVSVDEVRFDALYAVSVETPALPALAIGAEARVSALGVDPWVRAVATRSVPGTARLHRLYGNVALGWNAAPAPGEATHGWLVAVGYGVRVGTGTLGLAGLVLERDPARPGAEPRAELGLRSNVGSQVVVSLGTGVVLSPARLLLVPVAGVQAGF